MRPISTLLYLLFLCQLSVAQTGVNTTSPDNSAELDVSSTNKGLLIPRLTDAEMTTLGTGAGATEDGLMIYNTTQKRFFYYNSGAGWQEVGGTCIEIADEDGDTKIQVEKTTDEDKIRMTSLATEKLVIDDDSVLVKNGNLQINSGTLKFGTQYSLPTADGSANYVLGINNSNQVLWRNPAAALGLVVGIETMSFANVDQSFNCSNSVYYVKVVAWSNIKITKMAFLMEKVVSTTSTPQLGIYNSDGTSLLTSGVGTAIPPTTTPALVEVSVTPYTLQAGMEYWFAIADNTGGALNIFNQIVGAYTVRTQSETSLPTPANLSSSADKCIWISAY